MGSETYCSKIDEFPGTHANGVTDEVNDYEILAIESELQ